MVHAGPQPADNSGGRAKWLQLHSFRGRQNTCNLLLFLTTEHVFEILNLRGNGKFPDCPTLVAVKLPVTLFYSKANQFDSAVIRS